MVKKAENGQKSVEKEVATLQNHGITKQQWKLKNKRPKSFESEKSLKMLLMAIVFPAMT